MTKWQMTKTSGDHQADLEDRTYEFARCVRVFVKKLPRTICNAEDVKQVVRSSGSVGANYFDCCTLINDVTRSLSRRTADYADGRG